MTVISSEDSKLLYLFFSEFAPVSDMLFAKINALFEKKIYSKGSSILKAGDIETKAKLVIKGTIHQYVYDDEDNITTINLTPKGMAFNSLKSYLDQSPSHEIHEAITDVELLQIDKVDLEELLQTNHEFGFILVKVYEFILLDRENRTYLLQHKNPTKRFILFNEIVTRSNHILEGTPDKYIASYLNMTPQQYSKEKKKSTLLNQ